ncbi:MAG: DUF2334 domain-containing protein [Candidatus Ratteibacteria bacterium]|jgi:peptidoglycan/xylan/chitin deacetylase (PgdA/CDA1 family)
MAYHNIRIKILIALLLLFIPLTSAGIERNHERNRITVVFRYDDYSSLSPTNIELKLIETFKKYDIPCTFGVIPCVCVRDFQDVRPQNIAPLTPTKINILKDAIKAGVLEVALHGFSHQTIHEKRYGYTEFSGLDYNSQVTKITKGKNYLEKMLNVPITTFIPPWNSYDPNTIRVLEKLGFKTISADKRGAVKKFSPLEFRPERCGPNKLRDKIKSARCTWGTHPVIIVLFHAFEFLEVDKKRGNITYQDFDKLLSWIASQKDIRVQTIGQLTNTR